jgi:hypothetical protein
VSYKTGANQRFRGGKMEKIMKGNVFFSTKLVQTSRKPANDKQNIEKCAKYCVK